MEFSFHSLPVKLVIEPAEVARFNEGLGRLRAKMIEKSNGDVGRVDAELARRLFPAVEGFGTRWMGRTSTTLDNIATLREHLTDIREGILKGEFPRADVIRDDYAKLDTEMRKLVSPKQAIGEVPTEIGPKGSSLLDPITELSLSKAFGDQGDVLATLDVPTRKNLRMLAETDADAVRNAVVAESDTKFLAAQDQLETRLRGLGRSQSEIDAAKAGLETLNKSWRDAQAKALPADHVLNVAKIIGELPSEDLRNAVDASPGLRRLAYTNPEGIRELWNAFKSKKRTYKSFEAYVKFCSRLMRGNLGEWTAAFAMGDEWVFLKGPDYMVYLPGTDLVAVNTATGEVRIIDNKAFTDPSVLDSVNALTRNLPKNILDDVLGFQKIAGSEGLPIDLESAVGRLERANAQIVKEMGGLPKSELAKPARQARIADILESYGIGRWVTNAGGNLEGIAPHLAAIKIQFGDLNLAQ
jgi:hypothetical protein